MSCGCISFPLVSRLRAKARLWVRVVSQYTGSATKPWMTAEPPSSQAERTRVTRDAYDRLASVWASTTDDGPFNGLLERPALRSLVPRPLAEKVVLDAGCGSGAQCEWLLNEGAHVIGIDLSPAMVEEAMRRCGEWARIFVADLAEPLTHRARDA